MDIKTLNEEFRGARFVAATLEDGTLTILFRVGDNEEAQSDKHLLIVDVAESDIEST